MAENFQNMRCRLQRLCDLKIFSGWIESFDRPRCQIRVSGGNSPIVPGQTFQVEVVGAERKVSFSAVVHSMSAVSAVLTIESAIHFTQKQEAARIYVQPVHGHLESDGVNLPMVVVDASETGIGLIVEVPIEKSKHVTLCLIHGINKFHCTAEVRYCRPLRDEPGKFRCGLLIQHMSRIDRARFLEMINNPLGAAA